MSDDSLPVRLRQVRESFGLSAAAMAARVGLSVRQTWERYERGDTRPNSDVLAALYDAGIDLHWLVSGAGSMVRPADSGAQADRLYEQAIAAALEWYDAAGLSVPPDSLAGQVSRAVRMIRARPDIDSMTDAAVRAEVGNILDIARAMLSQSGWTPN